MMGVTFDFWGTLFTESAQYSQQVSQRRMQLVWEAAQRAGLEVTREQVHLAFREAALRYRAALQLGQAFGVGERVNFILAELEVELPDPERIALVAAVEDCGLLEDLTPLPGTLESLPELAQSYLLGIVSNTGLTSGRVIRTLLERHGLLANFAGFSFSDETGWVKPWPQAFAQALAIMGVAAQEACHVGDIAGIDIMGARQAGYARSVLYIGHRHRGETGGADALIHHHGELMPLLEAWEAA